MSVERLWNGTNSGGENTREIACPSLLRSLSVLQESKSIEFIVNLSPGIIIKKHKFSLFMFASQGIKENKLFLMLMLGWLTDFQTII